MPERKPLDDRQLDAVIERLDKLVDEIHVLNRRLDHAEGFARVAHELRTLNESLQAIAYAALGQQGPDVRRLAERGEGRHPARLAPVVDRPASRDPEAPDHARAVVAVEVTSTRRPHGAAAIDGAAGHRAIAARVAVDLNGLDERSRLLQP